MQPWDENWVAGTDLPAIINISMTGFRMTPAILIRYRMRKKIEIFQQFVEMASFLKPKMILRVRPKKKTKALIAVCKDFLVVGCRRWLFRGYGGPLNLGSVTPIPQGSLKISENTSNTTALPWPLKPA